MAANSTKKTEAESGAKGAATTKHTKAAAKKTGRFQR